MSNNVQKIMNPFLLSICICVSGCATQQVDTLKINQSSAYIPINTILDGELSTSVSLNIKKSTPSDPRPVIIKLYNIKQLPTALNANVKTCTVNGSGAYDVSTQRIAVRLNVMSCIFKSGNIVEVPIKGYLADNDKLIGLKGVEVLNKMKKSSLLLVSEGDEVKVIFSQGVNLNGAVK
jgi:conjugal transfer pilus assembly protein TraB